MDNDKQEYNLELLLDLINRVPYGLDKKQKPEKLSKELRKEIEERDKMKCRVCGLESTWGNKGWGIPGKLHCHHIIPNGPATQENLITLCVYCHDVVHLILYRMGKWRHLPPFR